MQSDAPSSFLTPTQLQICQNSQKFVQANSPQIQQKLKNSNWQDMYAIILNPNIDNNTRIVCCSVMKWLIYHNRFANEPLEIFKAFLSFYTQKLTQTNELTKAQEIIEIVLKTIPSVYFKQKQKQLLITELVALAKNNSLQANRILKILQIIIQQTQPQTVNNEVTVGQIIFYLEYVIKESSISQPIKIQIIKQAIKVLQVLIDLINNDDQAQSNIVLEYCSTSMKCKEILEQIINDGTNSLQIITMQKEINQVKYLALELYSSIWVYYLDQFMFKLCLNSLLTRPVELVDEQSDIMERIVVMIERSISQQAYYPYLHKNIQQITVSLLGLLKVKQSLKKMVDTQPQEYVDILNDLCMEQQREMLQVKACSLIACLCLYIDGYMSFLGSLCIMVIKKFNKSLDVIPGSQEYMKAISGLWQSSQEQKISTCVLVLCSISDQLEKRGDLFKPLQYQLANMNSMFNINQCNLPPYLICRFMFLYAFMAYPKCMDVFLPYKQVKPVYQYQLQNCYNILKRYYAKYPQYKKYIEQIGQSIVIADKLTPLLQTTITTGQLSPTLQFEILQKLVIWLDSAMSRQDKITCNKMSNLISILIGRMVVQDYKQVQEAVFRYIEPLIKKMLTPDGHDSQQFLLQIVVAFIKRFPSLQKNQQRLNFFLNVGFKIVQRNNNTLNTCLNLFFNLTQYLSQTLVCSLIHTYLLCLQNQQRQQDHWQCYYGLENCMIRLGEIRGNVPHINMIWILNKIKQYQCKVLVTKAYMFIYSTILVNPQNPQNYQQYIINRPLPTDIPPYENKPYCIYLLNLALHLNMNQEYAYSSLLFILHLIQNQKQIGSKIKSYEEQIYNNVHHYSEVVINAYGITRDLVHPLITKNIDIYGQFRRCWAKYPHKEYIMSSIDEKSKKYLTQLCTQTTVNHKVRKILKIKVTQQNNQPDKNQQNEMM